MLYIVHQLHSQYVTKMPVQISFNCHQENQSMKSIPLKPHFYIQKMRFAGIYLFFLFLIQNRLWVHNKQTCPCNENPLKPHLYIEINGFAWVYLFFVFFIQNIDCGYSLEPPSGKVVLMCTRNQSGNQCFEQKYRKHQNLCILHERVFVCS